MRTTAAQAVAAAKKEAAELVDAKQQETQTQLDQMIQQVGLILFVVANMLHVYYDFTWSKLESEHSSKV